MPRTILRRLPLLLTLLLLAACSGDVEPAPTIPADPAAVASTSAAPASPTVAPPTATAALPPTAAASPTSAATAEPPAAAAEPTSTSAAIIAPQEEFMPPVTLLREGWHRLQPAGDTACALGDPYSFFVRPADPQRLLIYFQGGGACWDGATCTPGGSTTDQTVNAGDSPERGARGIFELDNEANPFRDYSMVFVPYCTGDVHLGDQSVSYETATGPLTVHHNGYNNAAAVLDWTFANYTAPESVFVAGSSAGAVPTPFYAHLAAEQYPTARITQLGDAAGGYRGDGLDGLLETWGTPALLARFPEYDLGREGLTFDSPYLATGRLHPEMQLAQYNTAYDTVQIFFLRLIGEAGINLPQLIRANDGDIAKQLDNYDSFLAGGSVHTILQLPQFYSFQADGVRVRDWVAALEAGEAVDNVRCIECTLVERPGDN